MLMKVLERWSLVSLIPEKGDLASGFLADNMRKKLLIDASEMEELKMVTGVVCGECGSPVENRGSEEEPKYFCITCGDFIEDTDGLPNRTIWSQEADVGKEINFKKSELRIFVTTFNKLDESGDIEPRHIEAWKLLNGISPKMFPIPGYDDEDDDE